jgi:hypothetical protein
LLVVGEPQLLGHQRDGVLRPLDRRTASRSIRETTLWTQAGSRNRATASRALAVMSSGARCRVSAVQSMTPRASLPTKA